MGLAQWEVASQHKLPMRAVMFCFLTSNQKTKIPKVKIAPPIKFTPKIPKPIFTEIQLRIRYPGSDNDNTEKKFECYITGIPTDLREFYGNLLIELENASGNWIKLTDLFWNFEDYFKNEKKKYKEIPEPLLDVIKKACEDYDLSFEIEEEISMQERANNKKDLRLLIFGNEIVSPHTFYLKQPYIIADSFEAIRVK